MPESLNQAAQGDLEAAGDGAASAQPPSQAPTSESGRREAWAAGAGEEGKGAKRPPQRPQRPQRMTEANRPSFRPERPQRQEPSSGAFEQFRQPPSQRPGPPPQRPRRSSEDEGVPRLPPVRPLTDLGDAGGGGAQQPPTPLAAIDPAAARAEPSSLPGQAPVHEDEPLVIGAPSPDVEARDPEALAVSPSPGREESAENDGMLAVAVAKPPEDRERLWLQPWTWTEVEWMREKLRGDEHPLDATPVKIADQEVKTAIWGPNVAPRRTYEDEYDHFPYFSLTVSVIQLMAYVASVGPEASWSGPPSEPDELWMRVYDQDCNDLRNQVWRLWTYQWMHGSLGHVVGNCIANILLGGLLEAVHGTRNIGILYTFGVLTGALTCGAFQPHMPVVGSSGGVYTMLGARIINIVLNKDQMPKTFWLRVTYLFAYFLYDTITFATSYSAASSYAAHGGGWICGLLFGGYWLENLEEKP